MNRSSSIRSIKSALRARVGVVTGTGMVAPQRVRLQLGAGVYMGASDSPSFAIIVEMTDDIVVTMNTYDYSRTRTPRWIAEDLIAKGTRKHIERYAKHCPEQCAKLERFLAGEDIEPENLRDYDRIEIMVRAADGTDRWRDAEEYGGVYGMGDDDGLLVVEGFRYRVEGILADDRFVVESQREREIAA